MIAVILIVAAVYTLPNFYGESPAVQVSPGKATVKVTEQTLKTVEDALAAAHDGQLIHAHQLLSQLLITEAI